MSLPSARLLSQCRRKLRVVLTVVAVLAIGMLARLDATILQLFHLSH
jgi:hypothetical protein